MASSSSSSLLCHPITVTPIFNTKLLHCSSSRRSSLLFNRRLLSVSATMAASSTMKVLIPVAHGTEPFEAVVMIDVLRRGGADVTVASVENQVGVDACHGIKIVADTFLSDVTDSVFDLIMLPGGLPGGETLKICKTLENMVKKQDEDGRLNAAICCAPALALGTWGLLEGKKATCYPVFMEKLATCAKAVESRVEIDGKIVTSRGPGTTMEFSVTLLEQLFGKDKASEVSGPLVCLFSVFDQIVAMCSKLSDQSHIDHRVLVDGNLITSRGPGTSLEFALAIVEKFYGREKGLQLAKATLV